MNTFEVLADDTRRSIIEKLAVGNLNATNIASAFTISRPAISRHLRVLREAGLVSVHQQAQQRIYQLEPGPLTDVQNWLNRYSTFWEPRLDELANTLERNQSPESIQSPGSIQEKETT